MKPSHKTLKIVLTLAVIVMGALPVCAQVAADTKIPPKAKPGDPIEAFQVPSQQKEEAPVEIPDNDFDPNVSYVYEKPSIEKFSQLYWALSKLDINSDNDIDYYMMINECDIYKDYYKNEFEWKSIRNQARQHIRENKDKFSLRFEIMQPITLGSYNIEKETFEIKKEDQYNNTRRMEIWASNYDDPICGYDPQKRSKYIPNYPRGLLVEFSRPLNLTELKIDNATARAYIEEKLKKFKSLPQFQQHDRMLEQSRDAYVVIKIKIFSYRKETPNTAMRLAEVMGILEGIEIYSDTKKTNLLYAEDYRRKQRNAEIKNGIDQLDQNTPLLLDDGTSLLGTGNR